MDSLTQIILGAATGELVLGKKIGNRAMLWGAVGGTIPDLDVMGRFFLSNIDNLAFHRGFSHSIVFAVLGAVVFGWLVHRLYQSKYHHWIAIITKALAALLVAFAVKFVFNIFLPDNPIPFIIAIILLAVLLIVVSRRRYFSQSWQAPDASLRDWQWLFFWSVFTHPILDCFTMYGTQLFAPFSDYRVAWNTVSVVDPMYTVPFLICLLVASFYNRTNKMRFRWNVAGIIISSGYLLFTVINKQRINTVFEQALAAKGVQYERYISGPTILNNILWNATVETENEFLIGQYSWFDEVPIQFNTVPKNHDLLVNANTDYVVKTLRWFSKDYYNVLPSDSGLQYNDMRFGTFRGEGNKPEDYIFRFRLRQDADGHYQMEEARGGPPKGGAGSMFKELMGRIMGLKKEVV